MGQKTTASAAHAGWKIAVMRYSEYFVKVPKLYLTDASATEQLLREAERIASLHIPRIT